MTQFRVFFLAIFIASLVVLAGAQFALAGAPTNLLAGLQADTDVRPVPKPRTVPVVQSRPTIAFSDAERVLIADHYGASEMRVSTTPRVTRDAPLPRGASYRALPAALDKRLPPVRRGYARVLVGADVALIELGSLRVVDVLPGIAG